MQRRATRDAFLRHRTFLCLLAPAAAFAGLSLGTLGKPQAATLDFTITFFFHSNSNTTPWSSS